MSDHDPTLPGDDHTLPLDPEATLAADGTASSSGPDLPERVGHYRPLRILG